MTNHISAGMSEYEFRNGSQCKPTNNQRSIDACPSNICTCYMQSMEANSHLIAAAPDVLAALKSVAEWVDILGVNLRNSVKEEIKAAIAKAEGYTR